MSAFKLPGLAACWLAAGIGLAGCGRDASPRASADADPPEFRIPAIGARAPIDVDRLGHNVFDSICRIGNPFAVAGWDVDPDTRFLYFTGPFASSAEGKRQIHPYLYFAIAGPYREAVSTELLLDQVDEADLRRRARPGELRRFELPHFSGLPADLAEARRQLGEPTLQRELESGRTRHVFARDLCLADKRLVGVYLDADGSRIVAAKGVDHPERLKWLISAGRPPAPDAQPTYYHDWRPRKGSPQDAALTLLFAAQGGAEDAGAGPWSPESPAQPLEDLAEVLAGSPMDESTLTYRTTRYELDLADVEIAFEMEDGRHFRGTFELRESEDERWLATDWREAS